MKKKAFNSVSLPPEAPTQAGEGVRHDRCCDDLPPVADAIFGGIFSVSPTHGVEMLDSFIIERIRRERESRDGGRIPLRIEDSYPASLPLDPQKPREPQEEKPERGVAIIDFTI